MKTLRPLFYILIIAAALTSCQGSTLGPEAWIDQPLDGSELKLEPVAVTVHASDSDGVSTFEIYLDEELIQTIAAGGKRLGEASWEWLPTEPGEYTIRVVPIDSQGNRGEKAQTVVVIAGDLPDLSRAPVEETLQAAIDKIECLDGLTVAVTIHISSPLGIESYKIWNTVIEVEHNETFQEPLPTNISKTVNITEPVQDQIDRNHQWGLKVVLPGQADPYLFYALEPDGRCPDHYQAVVVAEDPDLVDPDQVKARQNTACRQGPDSAFVVSGYLLQDEFAEATGILADNSWIQVQLPETAYICWIAANQLIFDPGLLATLPTVVPPPLPVTIITDTPEPDTPEPDTTAPGIGGLSTDPSLILTQGSGCTSYSRTTTIQATVTDNIGVNLVNASWNVGGESGQVPLTRVNGNIFQGVVGPVNTIGTLNISVSAWDAAGNSNSTVAPGVTVQNCIE